MDEEVLERVDRRKKKVANQHRITPKEVLDAVSEFMPVIALDPSWNPYAITNPVFSCDGVDCDGLSISWRQTVFAAGVGGVFVNPPWNNPRPWVQKAVDEALEHKRMDDILVWVPCYPETAAAQLIWEFATRICFWGTRVNHPEPPIDDQGRLIEGALKESGGSMWPTWLAYFGRRTEEFEKVFRHYGPVAWGWNNQTDRPIVYGSLPENFYRNGYGGEGGDAP